MAAVPRRGLRVGYVSGGWPSNIGNAFYNLGVLHALRRVYGEEAVFAVPDVAAWVWDVQHNFEPLRHVAVDLLFLSGPTLCHGIATRYRQVFDDLMARGGRVAFVSAGSAAYTEAERDEVVRFLDRYRGRIAGLATRDSETFELYRGLDLPVHDGVCGSVFLDEAVRVPELDHEPYVVLNFPRRLEPRLSLLEDGSVEVTRPRIQAFQRRIGGMPVVRTRSAPYTRDTKRAFDRRNMFYWDTPEGFLAVYKTARLVFSERVHTCASTLALGGTAMFISGSVRSHDNRRALLHRMGAEDIERRPVRLDRRYVQQEKDRLLRFLREEVR